MAPIYETLRAAAQADPEIAQLWDQIRDERRYGAGRVANAIADLGALRRRLGRKAAGDILWVLNDPTLHTMLVDQRGWSHHHFKTWLATAMQAELVGRDP